ncbi:hypothetical protein NEPAR06_1902 [Nematocida parisii]|nr:hypothetical protein NEPAR06_1902 [Nematocida parisii]
MPMANYRRTNKEVRIYSLLCAIIYALLLTIPLGMDKHPAIKQNKSTRMYASSSMYVHAAPNETIPTKSAADERIQWRKVVKQQRNLVKPPGKVLIKGGAANAVSAVSTNVSGKKKSSREERPSSSTNTVRAKGPLQKESDTEFVRSNRGISQKTAIEPQSACLVGYVNNQVQTIENLNAMYITAHSEEDKEVIGFLYKIAQKHPHLLEHIKALDSIMVNKIIINKDEVVVECIRNTNRRDIKTLSDVLQACSKGITIDECRGDEDATMSLYISQPVLTQTISLINHVLLIYCSSSRGGVACLSLSGFKFEPTEDLFINYTIFSLIEGLSLSSTSIYSGGLNMLCAYPNIRKLSFCEGTTVKFNHTLDLSFQSLERLELSDIHRYYADWVLSGTKLCSTLKEIEISNINCMETKALNKLGNLDKITSFCLRNVVFSGSPNFGFLKHMRGLQTLRMENIFYSYTEQLRLKELSEVKNSTRYLNLEIVPKTHSIPGHAGKGAVTTPVVAEENIKIGRCISPTAVYVDSKLYKDLGLCEIKPRKEEEYTISISFAQEVMEQIVINSIVVEFILNSAQTCLEITCNPITHAMQTTLEYIKCIDFPFLAQNTIEDITLVSWLKEPSKDSVCSVFSDQIFRYASYSAVRSIYIISSWAPLTMDVCRIAMFNRSMPGLKEISMSNVLFVIRSGVPENSNEEQIMQVYLEHIQTKGPDAFKCMFVKGESGLEIVNTIE